MIAEETKTTPWRPNVWSFLLELHRDERGFFQALIPWVLGLTAIQNILARRDANRTLGEDLVTEEQAVGSGRQMFANRGFDIGPESPAIQEAMRRRSLARRQEKARHVLSGPDPLATLFGLFAKQ